MWFKYFLSDTRESVIYARFGHFTRMTCCIQDDHVGNITWSKLDNDTQQWTPFIPTRNTLILEHGQILIIESVQLYDSGEYKCSMSSTGGTINTLENKFKLSVVTCDPLARGPFAIAPLPCDRTVAKTGDTVVLPCTGYFGCDDGADVRLVTWFVSPMEDEDWEEVANVDARYSIMNTNR